MGWTQTAPLRIVIDHFKETGGGFRAPSGVGKLLGNEWIV